jgi:hypothetical protein
VLRAKPNLAITFHSQNGQSRVWQPSAYIGGYGDLTSPQIRKYIHNFVGETDALATNVKLHETSSWHLEFNQELE